MKYLNTFLLFLSGFALYGQCGLTKSYIIEDIDNDQADTTNISILVEGAINNSLATTQQGVCGVQLSFRHPFMKELFVELISPSGQKITLVGGDIVATNTQLINWNVTFVPCNATASPDPGFADQWENDQLWQALSTYTGQYYPHLGCLEGFNSGPVNGTWTIRCIDNEDGGKGTLLDAKIIFCQDQGVSCGECSLNPGFIHNPDFAVCQGDASLQIEVDKTFPNNVVNTDVYDYSNIIFKDSTVIAYSNQPDLTSFAPGRYTICGTQVSKLQANIMPIVGAKFDPNTLKNYLFSLGACAALTDRCMVIDISASVPPITRNISICRGSTYTINGQTFDTQGNYEIIIENGACDSLINLNLNVIDIRAKIVADRDSISCNGNTIGLEGSNAGSVVSNLTYHWFTENGMISGDPSFFIVDAIREGKYFLEITGQFGSLTCKDTTMKEIFPDRTFPVVSFENEIINCLKDTVFIKATISRPTVSTHWSSKEMSQFIATAGGIRVWNPGIYYISVLADNGCITIDSIEVFKDTYFKEPVITTAVLDCRVDSVAINVEVDDSRNLTYAWSNVPSIYSTSKEPFVKNSGNYIVTITDVENGCTGVYSLGLADDKVAPQIVTLTVDTITCARTEVTAVLMSDVSISSYTWTGPNYSSSSATPVFTREGSYEVTIISSRNGCSNTLGFEIFQDTDVPIISLTADSLTCIRDSVQIILQSDKVLESTIWRGPEDFTSNEASPYVKLDGLYNVTAIAKNGCRSQLQILVSYGLDIPDALLPGDSLKCGLDTIRISLIPKQSNYTYHWDGPGLIENNVATPFVDMPGQYTVTITDSSTGCTAKKVVNIVDDRIYTTPDISVGVLDCIQDSVQIVLRNTDVVMIIYEGPGFYSETLSPFVTNVGTYNYTLTNVKNCITTGSIEVITNDEIPVLEAISKPILCNQDSFLLEAKSSIIGTVFTWSGPDGFDTMGSDVYAFIGGDYILKGIAPNGCRSEVMFKTTYDTIAPVFEVLPYDILTCKDSVTTLATNFNPSDGQIIWMNSVQSTLDVTIPGDYTVTVIAANQCSTSKVVSVVESKNFPQFVSSASLINCKDMVSDIAVSPTTPYANIKWRNDTNPSLIIDGTLTTRTSSPGIFIFEMSNDEACITVGQVEVLTDLQRPIITNVVDGIINCDNPTINIGVSVTGDIIEYLWNGPGVEDLIANAMININREGQYFLKITGSNYCVTNQVFDILKDDDLPKYSLFTDTLTCDRGKINIGVTPVTPNLTYNWSGPMMFDSDSRTPRVFEPGIYLVTVTGANGCFLIDSVLVIENIVKPLVLISDTLYLPCDTSAILLTVESDVEILRYNWIFPDGSLVNTANPMTNQKGNYRVQVAGLNGCGSINKSFFVDIDKTPPGFSFTTDTINCKNPVANLIAQSPIPDVSYEWRSPSGVSFVNSSILTTESGAFLLIVSDKNKCRDSIIVTVALDTISPKVDIQKSGDIQCAVRLVTLDAGLSDKGSDLLPSWSTTNGNILTTIDGYEIELDKAGSYTFLLSNNFNGCSKSTTILIDESPQQFTVMETESLAPVCDEVQNGSISIVDLNGIPPFMVTFDGVDRNSQMVFSNLHPGSYSIEVTDGLGCKLIRDVIVPKSLDLTLDIPNIFEINFGDSVLLRPLFNVDPSGQAVLNWYKRDTLICGDCEEIWVRPFVNTYYTVEYSSGGFCKQKVDVLIKVANKLEEAIPNIFRPTSGNGNSVFFIPQTRGIEMVNSIYIFDRWAENVFSANNIPSGDASLGWDGNFKGEACQPGIYIVIAELTLANGTVWKYRGDVLLVR